MTAGWSCETIQQKEGELRGGGGAGQVVDMISEGGVT